MCQREHTRWKFCIENRCLQAETWCEMRVKPSAPGPVCLTRGGRKSLLWTGERRCKVLCVLLSPLSSSLSERALQSACCPCLHRPVTATVDRAASCSFSLSPTALCPRILRPSIATTRPFQRSFFRNQKVSSPVVLYLFFFCFSSLDISRPLAIDTHYYIPPHSKCTRNISHTFDPAIIICVDHRSSGLLGPHQITSAQACSIRRQRREQKKGIVQTI